MKLKEATGDVQTTNVQQVANFRIKASQKAFAILSSSIYSDRVKACIRELSTNAADSHVSAGKKDEPFIVHLPNNLEPYFSVKDNGTGMSEHQINTLYTTYFDSDKTESDDVTGCLGLGSKSPFSYAEQFAVESRYNGVKYIYNCFIDSNRLPAIAKLGEIPTDECNGFEVRFPVKRDDFYEFKQKAQEVLSWFIVRPTIKGDPHFQFIEREYITKTDKYGLSKTNRYNDSHVVMGNVAYVVNASEITKQSKTNFTEYERKVLDWGVDLFVPIGSIDFTANREEVSYDAATTKVIRDTLRIAVEDIQKEAEKAITSAPTLWSARKMLHESKNTVLGQLRNILTVQWNGQSLDDHVNVKMYNRKLAKIAEDTGTTFSPVMLEVFNIRTENYKRADAETIYANNEVVFINDMERGGYSVFMNYLKENNIRRGYLLTNTTPEFLQETGLVEIVKFCSTLPKPERKPRATVKKRSEKALLNKYTYLSGARRADEYWTASEVDLTEGGIYVEIVWNKWKRPGFDEPQSPDSLRDIGPLLKEVDGEKIIYGVRSADVEKLHKHGEWRPLFDYAKEVLERERKTYEKDVRLIQEGQSVSDSRAHHMSGKSFGDGSLFGRYLQYLKEVDKAGENWKAKNWSCLATKLSLPQVEVDENDNPLKKLQQEVHERYPLLLHLNWWNVNDDGFVNGVVDYIKSIDARYVTVTKPVAVTSVSDKKAFQWRRKDGQWYLGKTETVVDSAEIAKVISAGGIYNVRLWNNLPAGDLVVNYDPMLGLRWEGR